MILIFLFLKMNGQKKPYPDSRLFLKTTVVRTQFLQGMPVSGSPLFLQTGLSKYGHLIAGIRKIYFFVARSYVINCRMSGENPSSGDMDSIAVKVV